MRTPTGHRPAGSSLGVVFATTCGGCQLPDVLFQVRLRSISFEGCSD